MNNFLSGVLASACLMIALTFLRFYVKSRDRLFLCFSFAFLVFAVERVFISMKHFPDERGGEVIVMRLISFLIILWAIIDKNKRTT